MLRREFGIHPFISWGKKVGERKFKQTPQALIKERRCKRWRSQRPFHRVECSDFSEKKNKMQDLTSEDFWKGRRHVSSFMDRVLMRGQVRQLAAPCINISPDFSLKRQDLLPQKSGFVGSEIKFCGGENVRGIPGKASFQLSPPRGRVSLFKTVSQSTVEMKIEEEISGRQTVSIKPHSRLTNKLEEGPKERAQAAPAKYLDIWIQNNIECQYI